ncbi:MAG: family 20 glycosylhydrolase [Bacteroidales bacterium]|nr:family 20 glycosylhydrolase [Bacteroidales bacterium]
MKLKQLLVGLALIAPLAVAMGAPKETNPKPFVIPELRQWKGATGSFTPQRITYANDSLQRVADRLAADWTTLIGGHLATAPVAKPQKGDIHIACRPLKKNESQLGTEGYIIEITPERAIITAPTATAAYWATRTLLQMAEQAPDNTLVAGTITDWPDYGLRGLSLDVGRKFFPMDYVEKLAQVLSYYKLNSLRLHLNDNGFPYYFGNDWDKTYAAFRMECDTYPGLTARDGYYTKQEYRDLVSLADSLCVDIMPEIDIPAHALAFAHYKPEIGSKEFGMDHLDLFNPETMPFLDALFAEYLGGDDPVFSGPNMHIGTDEFGKDYEGFDKRQETIEKFRAFADHYIRLVESYGKTPWVWGSLSNARGETPVKTEGLHLDAWYNGYADPLEMVELGCKLNSIPDGMVYIVPMAGYYHDYLNTEWLYNNWTPARVGEVQFEEQDPALLGGYFAVWNDHVGNGVTVKDVHHRVMPALQTLSGKMWAGPNVTVPYEEFDTLRLALSEAPGINELARVGSGVVLQKASIASGEELPIDEVGYGYTVEFDWEAAEEAPGTELFRSDNAVVYLADPVKGLLGFAGDGYLHTFNFAPYPGEKVHIAIEGDNRATTLYVNGKKYESLEPVTINGLENRKMYYLSTLVFPLKQAGQFNSKIKNLKVEAR